MTFAFCIALLASLVLFVIASMKLPPNSTSKAENIYIGIKFALCFLFVGIILVAAHYAR